MLVYLMLMTQPDFVFAMVLRVLSLGLKEKLVDLTLQLFVLLGFTLLLLFLIWMVFRPCYSVQDRTGKQKKGEEGISRKEFPALDVGCYLISHNLNQKSRVLAHLYLLLIAVMQFLVPVALVLSVRNIGTFCLIYLIFEVFGLVLLTISRPYESLKVSIADWLARLLTGTLFGVIGLMELQFNSSSEKERFESFGMAVVLLVGLLCLICLLTTLNALGECVQYIALNLKKNKNEMKKTKKEADSRPSEDAIFRNIGDEFKSDAGIELEKSRVPLKSKKGALVSTKSLVETPTKSKTFDARLDRKSQKTSSKILSRNTQG